MSAHADAKERAKRSAEEFDSEALAKMLNIFAAEIEIECGRAYAPAYMREAARRLMGGEVVLGDVAAGIAAAQHLKDGAP